MDVLAEIRQKLLSGKQPVELIKEGYAKSTVYHVAKKVRNSQLGVPSLPVDDELMELRRKREIVKLEKEIAELEAAKESLPKRATALEQRIAALERWLDGSLIDAVGGCIFAAWIAGGRSEEEAQEASEKVKSMFQRRA